VPSARYPRVPPGLASGSILRKETGDGQQSGLGRELGPHSLDEYTEEKFVHLDLSGRLDRRAYALLLGTPPA